MNSKQNLFFLTLFLLSLLLPCKLVIAQQDPELKARQLFENGQFQQALPIFKDLIRLYPKDPELNYHYGATLAETKQFSTVTLQALSIGKSTSSKSLLYLGEYYHSQNKWNKAIDYYNLFIDHGERKIVKRTNVDQLREDCLKKINPFVNQQDSITIEKKESKPIIALLDTAKKTQNPDSITIQSSAIQESQNLTIPESLKDSLIHFQINTDLLYLSIKDFKNFKAQQKFIEAWEKQKQLKSVEQNIAKLRKAYINAPAASKIKIGEQIIQLEKKTFKLHQEIQEAYNLSRQEENTYWEKASTNEIMQFQAKQKQRLDSIQQTKANYNSPASIQIQTNNPPLTIISDSTINKFKKADSHTQKTESQNSTTKINYRIQIGAYSKTPPEWVQRLFKKLSVIRKIDHYTDEHGVTVYTVGKVDTYKEAVQLRKQIKLEGVKNASIAAYNDNKRISIAEAKKFSKTK